MRYFALARLGKPPQFLFMFWLWHEPSHRYEACVPPTHLRMVMMRWYSMVYVLFEPNFMRAGNMYELWSTNFPAFWFLVLNRLALSDFVLFHYTDVSLTLFCSLLRLETNLSVAIRNHSGFLQTYLYNRLVIKALLQDGVPNAQLVCRATNQIRYSPLILIAISFPWYIQCVAHRVLITSWKQQRS